MSGLEVFSELTVKERLWDFAQVFLGNLLLALSSVYFVLPFHLLTGGVAGIAVVITKFTAWPPTVIIYVLIAVLYFVGMITLGKLFAVKTLLSSILYPLFVFALSFFPGRLDLDPVVASIYAGILGGSGVGIIFRTGGSSGGMDIPPLLMKKYLDIDLAKGTLIVDGITVVLGLAAYGLEEVLIGLISVYASSVMIDKLMLFGGEQSKAVYIISDQWQIINSAIQERLDRGTTLMAAKGGFSGKDRPILLVVIQQSQYAQLNKIVSHVDPAAFMIVSEATEVQGNGFSPLSRQ